MTTQIKSSQIFDIANVIAPKYVTTKALGVSLALTLPDGAIVVVIEDESLSGRTISYSVSGAILVTPREVTAKNLVGGSVSATTLTASGASTLQSVSATTLTASGNATLGSGTGNSHTVNGFLTITNELHIFTPHNFTGNPDNDEILSLRNQNKSPDPRVISFGGTSGTSSFIRGVGTTMNVYGDGGAALSRNPSTPALFTDTNANFSRVIPGGSTLYPDFACRAWVNFNGTNGAIRGSGNVTSVSRTAVGTYTVNFSSALPDANYSAVPGCNDQDGANGDSANVNSYTTTSFNMTTFIEGGGAALADKTFVNVTVNR